MATKGFNFDDDVKQLVHLLLRKHARDHNDFQRYDNIASRISFDIANRGIKLLGYTQEAAAPSEPKK